MLSVEAPNSILTRQTRSERLDRDKLWVILPLLYYVL
jgi:hypothetical protein